MATKEKALEGKKILIVDDEPDVLDTLEEMLPMCQVTKATSFEQAREMFETRDFDMAILDIMGVDGYKLLEIANEKKVIAVMLTAHALSPEHTIKSFKGGAAYYVPKDKIANIPIYLNDILEAKQKGKSLWSRWTERMDSYYGQKFGSDWKEKDKEFWKNFTWYT